MLHLGGDNVVISDYLYIPHQEPFHYPHSFASCKYPFAPKHALYPVPTTRTHDRIRRYLAVEPPTTEQ
jgi:hypothetical protein